VEGSCEHDDEPLGSLKLLGISRMAAQLAPSLEGLSSVSKYKILDSTTGKKTSLGRPSHR
jgi:hypothetical protein